MFPWQVFGLHRIIPTRRTSQNRVVPVSSWGFRTCLPLRGSSGISPDSLFILLAEKPWSDHHILGW
jgi:hypothetical protein